MLEQERRRELRPVKGPHSAFELEQGKVAPPYSEGELCGVRRWCRKTEAWITKEGPKSSMSAKTKRPHH